MALDTTDASTNALEHFRQLLGAAHVRTDDVTRARLETATFATSHKVLGAIFPANREQVQECMRIANRTKTPIYPVSGGKNWGLGSRVPPRDGCLVMDLGRMARIVDFDEQLAYVTVEPGVTFRQVYDFLSERRSRLMLNVVGSSPQASLIGNTVERGHGYGPGGDRFAHVCALEVVLPSGDCVHTGFGRFAGAKAAPTHRYGVGPSLDGLFTQSNLGIVTQLTSWLTPRPEHFALAEFILEGSDGLPSLIDALQPFRFDDRHDIQVRNHHKLSDRWWYYVHKQSKTANLQESAGGWLGVVGLYADSAEEVRARWRALERRIKAKVHYLRLYDRKLQRAAALLDKPLRYIGLTAALPAQLPRSMWVGVPDEEPIRRAYRVKQESARPAGLDFDLDRDRCGVLWCCPALPFAGRHVVEVVRIMVDVAAKHGFEAAINLRPMSARSIDVVGGVSYDRDTPGSDERAQACCEETQESLALSGYLPYRLPISAMDSLPPPRDDYGKLLSSLKAALDPNDVLAPGRYDFRRDWPPRD
jgi:4-cresol dehydrogenase (hydroxylating)